MSGIQETADLMCPDHARSKRSEDLSRVIQPTPVPKGGGFVASALLTAHGRMLERRFAKQTRKTHCLRLVADLELTMNA